ncbi:MAG: LamG-like jellyroll fold domain-containing protein [Thermoanaerobaculia bacterium]
MAAHAFRSQAAARAVIPPRSGSRRIPASRVPTAFLELPHPTYRICTFYNYSANPPPGLTYSWTATGGTITGIATQDNVDVVWSTLPGTLQLTVTDPATGCTATKSLIAIENCNPDGCLIPPSSLVNWWTFDEILGTTAHDVSGFHDNAATYVNGPIPVAGLAGAALEFDGVNDWVETPDQQDLNFYGGCILDFADPLTIDVWVHVNSPSPGPSSGLMTILDKRVPSTSQAASGYHLFLFNGRLGFQVNGTNYVAPASGPDYIDVADGQWHFVAVSSPTCRGVGTSFLYVDGKTVATFPRTAGFVNNAKLYIGARDPVFGNNFFHGALDELEIFKTALSEDELRAIFEARSHGKCKNGCSGKSLVISPAALPVLQRGVAYNPAATFMASGGTAPYTFAITTGTLPAGLTLGSNGILSGTPAAGTYAITVAVLDADGCRAEQRYVLTVTGKKKRRLVRP